MRVLAVNAGSSSLKLSVVEDGREAVKPQTLRTPRGAPDLHGLGGFVESAGALDAAGHRLVHGGTRFRESVRVEPDVRRALQEADDLAPLHNANGIAALDRVRVLRPDLPSVACFDTAFHTDLPEAATLYALPRRWIEQFGIRRYGFHGLSHMYASGRAAEMVDRPLSDAVNRAADSDADVTGEGRQVRVLVVKAREDLAIFHEVEKVRESGGLDAEVAESGGSPPAGA